MPRPLVDRVMEFIVQHDSEFRAGKGMIDSVEVPFCASYINRTLSENYYDINEALRRLAENPNSHIVLLWRSNWDPDIVYSGGVARIDSLVLEFIEKHRGDLLMESAMKVEKVDGVTKITFHAFNAAFIAGELKLSQDFVVCALRRLAEDPANGLSLSNPGSNNPVPRRDHEKVSLPPVVAAK